MDMDKFKKAVEIVVGILTGAHLLKKLLDSNKDD